MRAQGINVVHLLPPTFCREILEETQSSPTWSRSVAYELVDGNMVGTSEGRQSESLSEVQFVLGRSLRSEFEKVLQRYLGPNANPQFKLSTIELLRYRQGGYFSPHNDMSQEVERARRYSIVCYLSADFEGGATSFPGLEREIRCEPGDALIFPSHLLHGAQPVIAGIKYVAIAFLTDPKQTQ